MPANRPKREEHPHEYAQPGTVGEPQADERRGAPAVERSVRPDAHGSHRGDLGRPRVGELDGHRVWTFDLAINPRVNHTSVPDSDYSSDNYSAAVAQLPLRIDGRPALARTGFLRRPEDAAMPEVKAGTAELRRRFRVRSSSAALAQRILDDRVCESLTGPGRRFHYEIVHDRALTYGRRRWLGRSGPRRAALGLATQLAESRHSEPGQP
jgi:hypothetical protein